MSSLPRAAAVLVAALVCFVSSQAWAQANDNNPYKKLESSKGVWPVFYKPDPSDATYSKLMADGMCKPTGLRAQAYYKSKMVDVNALPEFSFEGKITAINNGSITATDNRSGESYLVMINESPAVSRVNVQGKGDKESLKPGAFVRFVGKVDASGTGAEPIDQIELTSPGVSAVVPVEPNKTQNLFGKILRHDGEHLVVLAPTGKVHRLSFDLKPEVEVSARIANYRAAAVGDKVAMKGRILRMTTPAYIFCFADELDIDVHGTIMAASVAAKK